MPEPTPILGRRRSLALAPLIAVTLLSSHPAAFAFMDHGGHISRDFAKGVLRWPTETGIDSEEIVLFTWAGDGTQSEKLTLFAFCASGFCSSDVLSSTSNEHEDRCIDAPEGEPVLEPTHSEHCESREGCLWAWELPHSRGNTSYAPPVVTQVGEIPEDAEDPPTTDRVFVATANDGGGGSVWSFDLNGKCHWEARFTNKEAKSGFYARPAVQELGGADDPTQGRLVFAPALNNSKMQVLFDGDPGAYESGRPWGAFSDPDPDVGNGIPGIPIDQPGSSGGRVRFGPIVECEDPCVIPEVFIGAENGNSKRGLYHFHVCPRTGVPACLDGMGEPIFPTTDPNGKEQDGYRLVWDILHPTLPMKLGGAIIQDPGEPTQRFLVATLDNSAGVAVFDVTRAEAPVGIEPTSCGTDSVPAFDPLDCFAVHERLPGEGAEVVRGAHRSRPIAVYETSTGCAGPVCACEPGDPDCAPVVYIGQKEGAPNNGGQVWKFRLRIGQEDASWAAGELDNAVKWYSIFEDGWGAGAGGFVPWPTCVGDGEGSIPTTSWSSPVVHEDGGSVFVSSRDGADGAGGIYKITQPVGDVCPDEPAGAPDGDPDYLLNYLPKNGWRSTGIFTGTPGAYRLHYGSSNDKLYTLDPDAPAGCGAVLWCYDIDEKGLGPLTSGDPQGGRCDGGGDDPVCCSCPTS